MRILVDTNVFLDVLLDRDGLADDSAAILDWCGNPQGDAWIAWHTLANLYYIGTKIVGQKAALSYLDSILEVFEICPTQTQAAKSARSLKMNDFEDALQAAAALAANAELIVTRNKKDFRNSPVEAKSPHEFLRKIAGR